MREKNPIFIEYYSHTKCDCYKIHDPWTLYRSDTIVLCPVSKGLEHANIMAMGVLVARLTKALASEEVEEGGKAI